MLPRVDHSQWTAPGGGRIMQIRYPPQHCQGRLDGRNGSHACAVIASLGAIDLLNGSLLFDLEKCQPVGNSLQHYVEVIRNGNQFYDFAFPDPHFQPLLAAYDAVNILQSLEIPVVRLPNGDLGAHDHGHFCERLAAVQARCQAEGRPLAGVVVNRPYSVTLAIYPTGHAIILDSHGHGNYGAIVAMLQTPGDWNCLTLYLATLVGQLRDTQFYLLSVNCATQGELDIANFKKMIVEECFFLQMAQPYKL